MSVRDPGDVADGDTGPARTILIAERDRDVKDRESAAGDAASAELRPMASPAACPTTPEAGARS